MKSWGRATLHTEGHDSCHVVKGGECCAETRHPRQNIRGGACRIRPLRRLLFDKSVGGFRGESNERLPGNLRDRRQAHCRTRSCSRSRVQAVISDGEAPPTGEETDYLSGFGAAGMNAAGKNRCCSTESRLLIETRCRGRSSTVLQSQAPVRNRPLGFERGPRARRQDHSCRYAVARSLQPRPHSWRGEYPPSNDECCNDGASGQRRVDRYVLRRDSVQRFDQRRAEHGSARIPGQRVDRRSRLLAVRRLSRPGIRARATYWHLRLFVVTR